MKYLLEVCLVALAFTTISTRVAAQAPVVPASSAVADWEAKPNLAAPGAPASAAQVLQKGISVQLPVANNAVPMTDADQEDSLIVSVTYDGSLYFGVDPISPATLPKKLRESLSNRPEKKLYIKADARTQYADVRKVLEALRSTGVDAPNLLTAQRDASEPGALVTPRGLEVLVASPLPSGSATVVQVLHSGQRQPTLKINDEQVPWASMQSMLAQLFHKRSKEVVLVKAEGILPFAGITKGI